MSAIHHHEESEECITIKLDHYIGSSILTNLYRTFSKNNSKLINNDQYHLLFRGGKLNTFKPPQLLYRASRDGFSAESFHKHCDDHLKVVIIVKSKEGDLFGGFTTRNLKFDQATNRNLDDEHLFTFRFENNLLYTFKLKPEYANHSIYRYEIIDAPYIVAFGYCFWICPDADKRGDSGSHQTEIYIREECVMPHSTRYFGGNYFFVEDLEVFEITD